MSKAGRASQVDAVGEIDQPAGRPDGLRDALHHWSFLVVLGLASEIPHGR